MTSRRERDERPEPVREGDLLWEPPEELRRDCRLSDFAARLGRAGGADYQSLWSWSVADPGAFWESLWRYFEVRSSAPYTLALAGPEMPGAQWFRGARLNYAEAVLAAVADDRECVVAVREDGEVERLTGRELRRQVAALAASLRELGVGEGDRVAAYLPNGPAAVVGCLAAASLGAVWSSCSPDFGEQAVLDRFEQISPKVLIACDGYRYGGREYPRREVVSGLAGRLKTLRQLIWVPSLGDGPAPAGSLSWESATEGNPDPQFAQLPFDHPLWVLYSSGTTGLPKPIVHGHGGIVLEHLKALALHADVSRASRFFWFTTTGWMMWNYLLSGLLVGATIVLYDGSPVHPEPDRLWRLIKEHSITHFGTSAGHIAASMKAGLHPSQLDLSSLRFVGSTGSPLSPEAFAWVYQSVKADVWLSSLSGGTDVCTAFLLGCPWLPVRAGVIQCRGLGAAVEAVDSDGRAVRDEVGELVISQPLPSMPVYFWGDPDGSRYREAYFSTFPGLWRHGDWIKIRGDGGVVMYGRSDSTINRHGVRMGTAEIYRAVEGIAEVRDSLVVDVPLPDGDTYMPLFVVLQPGAVLGAELEGRIRRRIRSEVSPRHVPDRIFQVADIPRTMSGKKLEIPVKRLLAGGDPAVLFNRDGMQNPRSLDPFIELAAATTGGGAPTA